MWSEAGAAAAAPSAGSSSRLAPAPLLSVSPSRLIHRPPPPSGNRYHNDVITLPSEVLMSLAKLCSHIRCAAKIKMCILQRKAKKMWVKNHTALYDKHGRIKHLGGPGGKNALFGHLTVQSIFIWRVRLYHGFCSVPGRPRPPRDEAPLLI